MTAFGIAGLHGGDHPLMVALAAIALDLVVAGLPGVRQVSDAPGRFLRRVSRWFEARLNRPQRSAASRAIRGGLVLAIYVVVAGIGGAAVASLAAALPEGWIMATLAVALLLSQRRQFDRALAVGRALRRENLSAARARTAELVAHDCAELDVHGVARGAVQSCARGLSDGVIGPILWYLLLGLPGLCIYRSVNALAREGACSSPRGAQYCLAASALDRVLSYLPGVLGGVMVAIAAVFVPTASPLGALRAPSRARATPLPLASRSTEAAMAGALGLALGGPVRYAGAPVSLPWIGDGRARATPQDVSRATYLFAVAALLNAALVALAASGTGSG